jgi:hypothetical protein
VAVSAFNKEFDAAGAEDKNLAAGISIVKDDLVFLKIAAVHHLSQGFTLFVIKKSKDGDFPYHRHGG